VSGTVTVGPRTELAVDVVEGAAARWCGAAPSDPLDAAVQLRAHGAEHRAVVTTSGETVHVALLEPAEGVAPGQAAVVYAGTRVVGSCTITRTGRS
jgi:tRNA-specific 2-thiouridylase